MAEVRTTSSSGGEKGTKPQAYNLIPAQPLIELGQLYGRGARKYATRNWERGYEFSKTYASLFRHSSLFMSGESIDVEMGLNHMSSVAWHAIVLFTFSENKPEFDDRPTVAKSDRVGKAVKIDTAYPASHTDAAEADRDGELEPRLDLVPAAPLARLAELYGMGIVKPLGLEGRLWSDAYARLMEHSLRFWSGENYDKHGVHHMIYALHYAFMLTDLYNRFPEYDDRFTEELGAMPIGFTSAPDA